MSAATDKTNLAELRRTMTLWHNRVTALGFDGVSDLIALAEAGGEEMKKAWPIGERIALKLMMIKQIGEGSTTANSLPHVARIADEALECIRQRPAAQATPEPSRGMIGMGAHALANELAQAVAQDDADPDGHDMSAGLFGPNVSAWLRKISAEYLSQPATPEPVGEAGTMPGTAGFTMACFHADKVPVGTKLYADRPATGVPEDVQREIAAAQAKK